MKPVLIRCSIHSVLLVLPAPEPPPSIDGGSCFRRFHLIDVGVMRLCGSVRAVVQIAKLLWRWSKTGGSRKSSYYKSRRSFISDCVFSTRREARRDVCAAECTLRRHVELRAAFQFVECRQRLVLPGSLSYTH